MLKNVFIWLQEQNKFLNVLPFSIVHSFTLQFSCKWGSGERNNNYGIIEKVNKVINKNEREKASLLKEFLFNCGMIILTAVSKYYKI